MSTSTTSSTKKVVFITGCSAGGIGGALVEEFARAGCIVYATARRLESMDDLDVELRRNKRGNPYHGEIRKLQLDVNDAKSVDEAVKKVLADEGRIDILVNNAGVLAVGPVLDVSLEEIQNAFTTNLFSVLRLTQTIVPHMAASPGKGLVMNIGSITALIPIPWGGIYAATKAALKSVSETMSLEFQPLGVKVMLIEPGGIKSNLSTNYAPRYSLPANSLYKEYLPKIIERIHISQSGEAMSTSSFAYQVVQAAKIPRPGAVVDPKLWNPKSYLLIGKNATLFWFMTTFVPRWFALRAVWKRAGEVKKGKNKSD